MTADYPERVPVFLVSTLTNDTRHPRPHLRQARHDGPRRRAGACKFNGDFKEEFKAKNDGKEEARLTRQAAARHGRQLHRRDPRQRRALHCNAELGAATMVAIKMAVESYRQRKTMIWDAKKEKVVS